MLPVVFMLLLGIVWFGRAFNIYSTIQQAAQQGAIVAARASCATCGNSVSSNVVSTVSSVLQASNLDPSQIKSSSSPGLLPCPLPPPASTGGTCTTSAGDNIWVCSNVQLNPGTGQTAQCGVVVSFQYPFQFFLPFTSLNNQQIILTAQAQSRMEN